MKEAVFTCYPWDLEDEGLDIVLARLTGEIGVDAVSIPVVNPRLRELRSRVSDAPRIVSMEAGAYFQPSSHFYGDCRIRPHPLGVLKARNPLEKIAKAAASQSLELCAGIVACRNEQLADRHPLAACLNVFGHASESRLCPMHPEVRAYLTAVIEDLSTNYPLSAIELADAHYGNGAISEENIEVGVPLDQSARVFLSWCFCSSCRQNATDSGIDVERVRRQAIEQIESSLALRTNPSYTFADVIDGCAECSGYHRMRSLGVASLVKNLRQRSKCAVYFSTTSDVYFSGADVQLLSEYCDGLVVPADGEAVGSWPERVRRLSLVDTDPARMILEMPCHPPQVADGPSLVSAVHLASQQGFGGVLFNHYGIAPEPCLDWVRQAIRYARRESVL